MCDAFQIGTAWLATGRGLLDGIRTGGGGKGPERLFTEVFDTELQRQVAGGLSLFHADAEQQLRMALKHLEKGGFSTWEQDRLAALLRRFRERSEHRVAAGNALDAAVLQLIESESETPAKPRKHKGSRASKK